MAALMLARLAAAPVDPYGADGAAWLEHHERVNVAFAFSELPVDQAINNSDGAFPPGLHLVSLLFGELEFDEAAVAATSLVSWLLLALAIGGCVRELSGTGTCSRSASCSGCSCRSTTRQRSGTTSTSR